jgi:tripartite-type tricarboxylate transporter receptor subunit TctC
MGLLIVHQPRVRRATCLGPALVAPALVAIALEVDAQPGPWPSRPVRVVIPFAPGGTPDTQMRMVSDRLAPRLGQPVVYDYRPGAAGSIGMEVAARAPADGYTLVAGTVGSWAVTPHLQKLGFDTLVDLAPIVLLATAPAVLVVHPSVPARSVKELIAVARQRPGQLNYGSTGIGGFGHISAELFSSMTGTRMTHVAYKGAAPALGDLLGGHIEVLFNSAVVTVPYIEGGRVRALATTGARRLPLLPQLPTVAEAGVAGYENSTWTGIGAPARTPADILARLNREFVTVLALPEVQARFTASGAAVVGGSVDEFRAFLHSEHEKFGRLLRKAGGFAQG